ncbi:MAG: M48 family metallopeptidase [Pseudomonadota bacterium]|nr:M48 family metallopeptidase [Pseudomonadota bacterium]
MTLFRRRLLAPTTQASKPQAIERDAFELLLPDGTPVTVQRVRDPRARRLKLSVDERGPRLTLPRRASLVSGERFVAEHRHWLAQQLARHSFEALPALVRDQTDTLPLRDRQLPLRWEQGRYTCLQHAEDETGDLVFALPQRAGDAAIRRALRDFYEAQARADVGRWMPGYLPGLPRPPSAIRFKSMTSQWGSLAPNGAMALDLSLVLARRSAFEYVLVHELCHLIHADHSRAFWREVEARCPHWRGERDYFRSEGRRLKATLRALCGPAAPTQAGGADQPVSS